MSSYRYDLATMLAEVAELPASGPDEASARVVAAILPCLERLRHRIQPLTAGDLEQEFRVNPVFVDVCRAVPSTSSTNPDSLKFIRKLAEESILVVPVSVSPGLKHCSLSSPDGAKPLAKPYGFQSAVELLHHGGRLTI